VKTLRKLLARYAEAFPDARAAYALVLWDQGDRIEAEPWRDNGRRDDDGGIETLGFGVDGMVGSTCKYM